METASAGSPTKGFVFLIEDDEVLRGSIADLLRFAGYEVSCWEEASAFLDAIPDVAPAVLVTDMRMPGLSGVELHAELLRRGRAVPVVYISGESSVPQSVQAMKQGAFDFLVKPFGRESLLKVVAGALEKDRRQRQAAKERSRFESALAWLTPRQREVYALMARGCTNRDIVEALGISLPTAKQYKSEVMRKLGVRSLAELLSLSRDRDGD